MLLPVQYDTHRPILCTWTPTTTKGNKSEEPDTDPDEVEAEEEGDTEEEPS